MDRAQGAGGRAQVGSSRRHHLRPAPCALAPPCRQAQTRQARPIPSSGEILPVVGLGTWQTFDVAGAARAKLVPVVERFAAGGGRVIDTSPMYGRAEEAVGELKPANAFLATKVWTTGRDEGIEQMERS